jgi:hypothetical protein
VKQFNVGIPGSQKLNGEVSVHAVIQEPRLIRAFLGLPGTLILYDK